MIYSVSHIINQKALGSEAAGSHRNKVLTKINNLFIYLFIKLIVERFNVANRCHALRKTIVMSEKTCVVLLKVKFSFETGRVQQRNRSRVRRPGGSSCSSLPTHAQSELPPPRARHRRAAYHVR